jgi:hypothetical protein
MLNTMKVDSTLLSIPLDECKILHPKLKDTFQVRLINTTTGDFEDFKKYKGNKLEITKEDTKDGTSYHFAINKQYYYPSKGVQETRLYLSFLANSKHMKEGYFKGISKHTFKNFHERIMDMEVFEAPYSSFKNARYSDTDICFDSKCKPDDFQDLIDNFRNSFLADKKTCFHSINTTKNKGFWTPTYRKPRDQASPKLPFMKGYHKETELIYHSSEFFKKHLKYQDFKDLARMEFQVKNSDHKKSLGLSKKKTFWDFLNSDLQLVASKIAKRYIEKPKFKRISKMTNLDLVQQDMIRELLDCGVSPAKIKGFYDREDVSRMARKRLLEKWHELYSQNDINAVIEAKNDVSQTVFEFLDIKKRD